MKTFGSAIVLATTMFISGCGQPSEQDANADLARIGDADSILMANIEFAGEAANLPTTAKVFVYIREQGKTMPLAVEQFAPAELPVQVGFSKPDQIVKTIEAVARLSLSGAVMKHTNDPEVVSEALSTQTYGRSIQLVIPQTSMATGEQNSPAQIRIGVTMPTDVQISATAKLFIIAKMENASNPMPVAVKAYNIAEIPTEIMLTDRDSMTSVARLSRNKRVEVIARLSQSGTTKKQPGDWESKPQLVETKTDQLTTLVLNKEVEQ